MSVGWGETYGYHLKGQRIEIPGWSDGEYNLTIEVDPKDVLLESNKADNSSIVTLQISITNGTVEVIKVPDDDHPGKWKCPQC